jgi:enoyl reductase-like protein
MTYEKVILRMIRLMLCLPRGPMGQRLVRKPYWRLAEIRVEEHFASAIYGSSSKHLLVQNFSSLNNPLPFVANVNISFVLVTSK